MLKATNPNSPVARITGAIMALCLAFLLNQIVCAESLIDRWPELKRAVAEQLGEPAPLEQTKRADKCGVPLLTQAQLLNAELPPALRRGAQDFFPRPALPLTYDSPAGKFRIHYATTGDSAVYQATVDNVGPLGAPGSDGVPDFVNHTADIFDSVWTVILGPISSGNLGYPVPPDDSTYGSSSSALYDVYMPNLRGTIFGLTAPEDSAFMYYNGNFAYPRVSFIVVDNDYQEPSYSQVNNYQANPLDAMRVTAAHEFFHAIHFGIDGSEYPIVNNRALLFFQEMSSVSMEEYIYDEINDYYGYLYSSLGQTAFATPERSFQTFNLAGPDADFPYSMGVFMIYLVERFGPEIMRGAWEGCGRDGSDALRALDSALISFTANEYNFNRAYNEFGTWLLFTGDRANIAPPGVGFEEAAFYPMVPDTIEHTTFPVTVTDNVHPLPPEVNSNSFVFFKNVFTTRGLFADCFKALVAIPTFTVSRGVQPRMSLIGIPRNFGEKATITTGPFNTIVLDTNLVVAENARDSLRQALYTEYQCHDIPGFFPDTSIFFIVLSDTTDGSQDTVHVLVKDFSPAETLENPQDFEYAVLQVTHTSIDMGDYLNVVSVAEYPYTYFVRDSSSFTLGKQPFVFFAPFPNPVSSGDNFVTIGARRADLNVLPQGALTLSVRVMTEAGEVVRTTFPTNTQLSSEFMAVDWDFTNQSGVEVAAGVYIILEQLIDESGEVVASDVAKIFVQR